MNIPIRFKGEDINVVIDDDDKHLTKYDWKPVINYHREPRTIYIRARTENGYVYLHRLLVGAKDNNYVVDHINGDTLDNRKTNLRIVTKSQNAYNSKKRQSSSKYRGVFSTGKRFGMRFKYKGYLLEVRQIDYEEEAAHLYDDVASKLSGGFVRTNF